MASSVSHSTGNACETVLPLTFNQKRREKIFVRRMLAVGLCCAFLAMSIDEVGASRANFFNNWKRFRPSPPGYDIARLSGAKLVSRRIGSATPKSTIAAEVSTAVKTKEGTKKRRSNNTGFYYGIREDLILREPPPQPSSDHSEMKVSPSRVTRESKDDPVVTTTLADVMGETLLELREMREDITALREELRAMKRGMGRLPPPLLEEETIDEESGYEDGENLRYPSDHYKDHHEHHWMEPGAGISALMKRMKRQREFDKIGLEVERWAERLLFEEDEEHGWKEVLCNKLVRQKYNKNSSTKCYIKSMKDQRGKHANTDDPDREFPCIKVFSTIDAPFEEVCAYLADESRYGEYNDLVIKQREVEEISPHSKICWGQSPQILFVKPRDFVTFCHHRWLRDGTQVVVNQACEHPDLPAVKDEKEGKVCRAYALRGANFISRDPDDPKKTKFALLAHADPGGLPQWACKTAVNAVAPIEPFKLFYNINKCVNRAIPLIKRAESVSSMPGRSTRPAGLSQLGYACFWPNGGGMKEGFAHHGHPPHADPPHHPDHYDTRENMDIGGHVGRGGGIGSPKVLDYDKSVDTS